MSLPDPYYQDSAVTIYHGDCREILPNIGKVDLVLTDPPYGIGRLWVGGSGHGWGKADGDKALRNSWDDVPPSPETIAACVLAGSVAIIWGGNYFDGLPRSRGWLVWTKPERGFTLSEAELAWTNRDTVIRVWDGPRSEPGREHPTAKPQALMRWCIARHGGTAGTVLDPFMGSGTTLRAAKDLGRKAIGIEIEERYCEIAAKRMAQEVMF